VLNAEPNRVMPYTDIADPHREKVRNDKEEPKDT
jgi:hypothetical protein